MFAFFRWLNLFSLDAVLVALLWQEIFARRVAATLSWQERLVLGLSVWIVYILDHVLDSFCLASTPNLINAPRHHFAQSHRTFLISGIILAIIVDTVIALTLHHSILIAGALLGIAATCYLGINTLFISQGRWLRGREVIISLIFALGCGLVPLLKTHGLVAILTSIFLFALLCMLNCVFIARMERNAPLSSLNLLSEPVIIIGAIALFFLLTNGYWNVFPIEIALCMSLFGLSLIPAIAKHYGYEAASLATDGMLILGALLALFI